MYHAPFLTAAAAAFFMLAGPAVAQLVCNERAKLLELLAKRYQEAPIAAGVTNTGGLVEILTDPKGHTWTIIVTSPQGISCLVAAGEDWRGIIPKPRASDTEAGR